MLYYTILYYTILYYTICCLWAANATAELQTEHQDRATMTEPLPCQFLLTLTCAENI